MIATTADTLPSDAPGPGLIGLAERGLVPDPLLRIGIRRACAQRLAEESAGGPEAQSEAFAARIAQLRGSPLAIETEAANRQHYELPRRSSSNAWGRGSSIPPATTRAATRAWRRPRKPCSH